MSGKKHGESYNHEEYSTGWIQNIRITYDKRSIVGQKSIGTPSFLTISFWTNNTQVKFVDEKLYNSVDFILNCKVSNFIVLC